ncbi:HDIG domain-containing protein [bacterium]|nr:HDIG domain-containing protein [bacterium]
MESSSDPSHSRVISFFRLFHTKHVLVLVINYVLIAAVLATFYFSNIVYIKIANIAPEDIYSPINTLYYNRIKTEELQKQAEEKVPVTPRIDPNVLDAVLSDIDNVFFGINDTRNNKIKTQADKIEDLQVYISNAKADLEVINFILNTDTVTLNQLQDITKKSITDLLSLGLWEAEIQKTNEFQQRIVSTIQSFHPKDVLIKPCLLLIQKKIQPNMFVDEAATNRAKAEARAKILPVKEEIIQNQKIVSKGQTISEEDLEKIKSLGLYSEEMNWKQLARTLFYALALLLLMLFYLFINKSSEYIERFNYFLLLNGIIFVFVLLFRFLLPISPYLLPAFLFTTLLVVFFDIHITFYVSITSFLLLSAAFGLNIAITVIYLLTISIILFVLKNFRKYSDYIKNGFLAAAIFAVFELIFSYLTYENSLLSNQWLVLALCLLNALISSLLALGITVLLESIGNFVTPLRLFELTDPNSFLLRKLFEETPGTYQHSVMIANISSHAAEEIGADPLLTRVGAYYHDIGKTAHPLDFTENNAGGNILDKMNPFDAVTHIKEHLEAGIRLAKANKLPSVIQDFILQHHGTTRISFLYETAKKEDPTLTDDSFFRYPGPKPIRKEVSIMMLADSVEAAVRSMQTKDTGLIREMVTNIVNSKLQDGQLSESELTFSEIEKVKESFVFTLDSLYHSRISYSTSQKKE